MRRPARRREGISLLLGCKSGRGSAAATSSINSRIEHQAQKLRHHLERALLRVSRSFARELGQCIRKVAAGEREQTEEVWRQRAAAVEEIIERRRNGLLVAAERRLSGPGRRLSQCSREIQEGVS